MPTRPTWSGSIQISLVSIAVKIFPATDDEFSLSLPGARISPVHEQGSRVRSSAPPVELRDGMYPISVTLGTTVLTVFSAGNVRLRSYARTKRASRILTPTR
jgi:hypothetical protein